MVPEGMSGWYLTALAYATHEPDVTSILHALVGLARHADAASGGQLRRSVQARQPPSDETEVQAALAVRDILAALAVETPQAEPMRAPPPMRPPSFSKGHRGDFFVVFQCAVTTGNATRKARR